MTPTTTTTTTTMMMTMTTRMVMTMMMTMGIILFHIFNKFIQLTQGLVSGKLHASKRHDEVVEERQYYFCGHSQFFVIDLHEVIRNVRQKVQDGGHGRCNVRCGS